MPTLFIDPLVPPGHVAFNSFVVRQLGVKGDICLVGNQSKVAYEQKTSPDIEVRAMPHDVGGGALGRALIQGHWASETLRVVRANGIRRVVFLSYHPVYTLLWWSTLRNRRVAMFAIEHNTVLSELGRSGRYASYAIGSRIVRLCLTRAAALEYRQRNIDAELMGHPMDSDGPRLAGPRDIIGRPYVYVASGSCSIEDITAVADAVPDIACVTKGGLAVRKNVVTVEDYDAYWTLIRFSLAVVLHISFRSRASGALFDALACGKRVLIKASDFAREMADDFPQHVTVYENDIQLRECINAIETQPCPALDVVAHNAKVRARLLVACAASKSVD